VHFKKKFNWIRKNHVRRTTKTSSSRRWIKPLPPSHFIVRFCFIVLFINFIYFITKQIFQNIYRKTKIFWMELSIFFVICQERLVGETESRQQRPAQNVHHEELHNTLLWAVPAVSALSGQRESVQRQLWAAHGLPLEPRALRQRGEQKKLLNYYKSIFIHDKIDLNYFLIHFWS
jgi:hypothetical protein